ncbi:MAG: hypothetical protein WBL20_07415 [Sphingobium sp.]|nr:MAG: hypothetical protein DI537_33030 [Stutzerimonas stutzeri]
MFSFIGQHFDIFVVAMMALFAVTLMGVSIADARPRKPSIRRDHPPRRAEHRSPAILEVDWDAAAEARHLDGGPSKTLAPLA